jgi:vacuolar protein sorting-associated protein 35
MLFHRTIFYIFLNYLQGACVKKLSGKPKLEDIRAKKQIVALLSAPLEKYNDIVTALTLSNYPHVMDCLDYETNKVMAMVIIQSAMKNNTCISTADKVKYPYIFKSHTLSFANMVIFAVILFLG